MREVGRNEGICHSTLHSTPAVDPEERGRDKPLNTCTEAEGKKEGGNGASESIALPIHAFSNPAEMGSVCIP